MGPPRPSHLSPYTGATTENIPEIMNHVRAVFVVGAALHFPEPVPVAFWGAVIHRVERAARKAVLASSMSRSSCAKAGGLKVGCGGGGMSGCCRHTSTDSTASVCMASSWAALMTSMIVLRTSVAEGSRVCR